MSNVARQPLFSNVLNLPWSVSKAEESVIVDANGAIVATIGLNLFPELAADDEACAERAKALVGGVNVTARAEVLRALNIGDVLGSDTNKKIQDQRIVRLDKDTAGNEVVIMEVVETGVQIQQSINWLQFFLEGKMIVVR